MGILPDCFYSWLYCISEVRYLFLKVPWYLWFPWLKLFCGYFHHNKNKIKFRYEKPKCFHNHYYLNIVSLITIFVLWTYQIILKLSGKKKTLNKLRLHHPLMWINLHHSKIEKGTRSITVEELQKMAQLFNMTTDQILNYDGKIFHKK